MTDVAPVAAIDDLTVATAAGDPIVSEVAFALAAGEILAVVGESGSGKTSIGLALLAYARAGARITNGSVRIAAKDLLTANRKTLRQTRGNRVAYVPQDPVSALDPRIRVGSQITEALAEHGWGARRSRASRVAELLDQVGFQSPRSIARRYPFELSGGQQQRIAIAIAIACEPELVVLDEPTTGLDVTTQQRILELIRTLADRQTTAFVHITHDLAVVANIADRVAVVYAGQIVETGTTRTVLGTPDHPYTRLLLDAAPRLNCTRRSPARATAPAAGVVPLLEVQAVNADYGAKRVLHEIGLTVGPGECLALVGESGSGKSTLGRCITGLHPRAAGDIRLDGESLSPALLDRTTAQRQAITLIFQNPDRAINPSHPGRHAIERALLLRGVPPSDRAGALTELLDQVRLPRPVAERLPHQLSGGEKQRLAIAAGLALAPRVLVCDEVTSALDVSIAAGIVELLTELRQGGLALIFITHDLALVSEIATDAIVMHAGRIVERGTPSDLIENPKHPYTAELVAAVPDIDAIR